MTNRRDFLIRGGSMALIGLSMGGGPNLISAGKLFETIDAGSKSNEPGIETFRLQVGKSFRAADLNGRFAGRLRLIEVQDLSERYRMNPNVKTEGFALLFESESVEHTDGIYRIGNSSFSGFEVFMSHVTKQANLFEVNVNQLR